jgi:hypothetical protein
MSAFTSTILLNIFGEVISHPLPFPCRTVNRSTMLSRDERSQELTVPLDLVRQPCLDVCRSVLWCNFRAQNNTPEDTLEPFGRAKSNGLSPSVFCKTRRVNGDRRRASTLAFLAIPRLAAMAMQQKGSCSSRPISFYW